MSSTITSILPSSQPRSSNEDNGNSEDGSGNAFESTLDEQQYLNLQKCNDLIKQIDSCNDPQQISNLQARLSTDYKDLVTEFANARLSRIEELITVIDKTSKTINKNNNKFEASLNNKIPSISKKYSTELENQGLLRKRRRSSATSSNHASPPPSPPLLPAEIDIPVFKQAFEHLSQPYVDTLSTIRNKFFYQSDLIERKSATSRDIIWKQFLKQRQDLKENRLRALNDELNELDYEYKGLRHNKDKIINEINYKRSRPQSKNDESTRKKLTKELEKRLQYYNHIINELSEEMIMPTTKEQFPNVITSLTEDEVQTDLQLIEFWKNHQDEEYRKAKQIKINNARESVKKQIKTSTAKIHELLIKQENDEKKSKLDFIKQQEELLKSSQITSNMHFAHHFLPQQPENIATQEPDNKKRKFSNQEPQNAGDPLPTQQSPLFLQHQQIPTGPFPMPQNVNFLQHMPPFIQLPFQPNFAPDASQVPPPPLPPQFYQFPPPPLPIAQSGLNPYQQIPVPPPPLPGMFFLPPPEFSPSPQLMSQPVPSQNVITPDQRADAKRKASQVKHEGIDINAVPLKPRNKKIHTPSASSATQMIASTAYQTPMSSKTGEFTTIKDIIAMKDKERANTSSYKKYYNANQGNV